MDLLSDPDKSGLRARRVFIERARIIVDFQQSIQVDNALFDIFLRDFILSSESSNLAFYLPGFGFCLPKFSLTRSEPACALRDLLSLPG
jgi:hypothetical protein